MPNDNVDFDLYFLYEIADGSDEFIVESIGMFLDQSPEILQEIKTAIDTNNWNDVAAAAHKIKANLGFFGMTSSQALIQDIEHGCKAGTPNKSEIIAKFSEVKDLMDINLVKLSELKAEKEANL